VSIEASRSDDFVVRDNAGQALAHIHFEAEPGRRIAAALLSRDETRRITAKHR
jgi:hypothetical protein